MRLAGLSVILLIGAIAGCVQNQIEASAALNPILPVESPFVRVMSVVDLEGGSGEPSFGVTPDGTIIVHGRDATMTVGPRTQRMSSIAFRSVDGGSTWENLGMPLAPMPNLDPDVVVDADGVIWYDDLWVGCTSVAVSKDKGKTWSSNPLVCNGPGSDRQYVIPTKGGTAYIYSHQLPTFWQMAAKTTDYGRTWVPTGPVESPDHHLLLTEGSGWGGAGFWNPKTDSIYFTFSWFKGTSIETGTWAPAYAVTRDGGASFEIGTLPNQGGSPVGLSLVVGAADAEGHVYISWAEAKDKNMSVWMAASPDDGKTWNPPVRVDETPVSKVFPAITAVGDGNVAIAYYESDDIEYPSSVKTGWNVTLAWTNDALAPVPVFEHQRITNRTIKGGPICPDGTGCSANRQFLDYFTVHALPDGRVGMVYNSLEEVKDRLVTVYAATEEPILFA